ncbi:MAG: YkgJ family cysteine cluster protein [Desulfatitalea sp.]|nr:YkgJ family cysteine cluster protein [Desulfatitalea sp.]
MQSETLFLTAEQALDAVCIDFRGYRPQPMVFSEILLTLTGDDSACRRERGKEGLWIAGKRLGPMRWLEGEALVAYMCSALRQARPAPAQLAAICRRVFQIPCRTAPSPDTGRPGIRVQTEMQGFVCRQCGRCCRSLAYRDSFATEDVARLKAAGRQDVLAWVGVTRTSDGLEHYRIWMTPGTNRFAPACPFLKRGSSNHRWVCAIQEIKPNFCRHYPLSRKHASMTGCPGFDA